MPRQSGRLLAGALLAGALLVGACGEPAVDLVVPERGADQRVLDQAALFDGAEVEAALDDLDLDAVAVTYETDQANAGEARRAGQLVAQRWDAELVLVAVARPGDFAAASGGDAQRFFGIEPADAFAVPGSLRERIVEGLIPPIAAQNRWEDVFLTALAELSVGLEPEPSP